MVLCQKKKKKKKSLLSLLLFERHQERTQLIHLGAADPITNDCGQGVDSRKRIIAPIQNAGQESGAGGRCLKEAPECGVTQTLLLGGWSELGKITPVYD